jgi:hypothetical protein
LLKFAQFYPSNFSECELSILKNQLENYRLDMHDNSEVKGIDKISQKLVEKKRNCLSFDLQITDIGMDITGDHR